MSKHLEKVILNDVGTVTLKFVERRQSNYTCTTRVADRWQITLDKREFERALAKAEITVPWNQVKA